MLNLKTVKHTLILISIAIIFVLSYTQLPLFSSNQNTYFVHGLATGGYGLLKSDWLANTTDPFQFFSFIVAFTHQYLNDSLFYIYYALILGTYIVSVICIGSKIIKFEVGSTIFWVYCTIVVAIHSALICNLTSISSFPDWITQPDIYGRSITWLLQAGVSHYYLLGPVFQPSAFGVLIILSILLFINERPYIAELLLVLTATIHSIYILPAAALTLSYMYILFRNNNNLKNIISYGLIALVLVAPIIIIDSISFFPQSPATMATAQHILTHIRYPWHAMISNWFNVGVIFQLLITIIAIYLSKENDISAILLIPFIITIVLTVIQFLSGNDALAMLAPWRISVILVPLSTCIILAYTLRYICKISKCLESHEIILVAACAITLILLALSGIMYTSQSFANKSADPTVPMMDFVKTTKSPGDVYLIPTDLLDFRLYTGVPIFIDTKSHPYKDTEVLEWYKRDQLANDFYAQEMNISNSDSISALDNITKDYKITDIVVRGYYPNFVNESISVAYTDGKYTVYSLKNQ